MSHASAYEIAPDSDDDDLVATNPQSHLSPSSAQTKGKGRASSPVDPLAGRIGSGAPGSVGERSTRSTFGGVQTETRCVAQRGV